MENYQMALKTKSKKTPVKAKTKATTKATTKAKKTTASKKTTTEMQLKAIGQKQTKNQILKSIAEETGLTSTQVKSVFMTAGHIAKCHLIKKGSGEFAIPEMAIKVVRKSKPATKSRQGRNPITGETITIAAKPKRDVIKVRPLKMLKNILVSA
jgi:nucleoid DNA-binding protein